MPSSAKKFQLLNPDFQQDVRDSFSKQGIMNLLGATIRKIELGKCIVDLPFNDQLTQQNGYFHAGATSAIADSAGGYAAFTLMPAGSRVLTVEFKINLIAPADGDRLSAKAYVIKPGRIVTVAKVKVYCCSNNKSFKCAVMQQTTICLPQ